MNNSFYNETELKQIGFKSIGKGVYISKKVSIYSSTTISIGDNVRIDDFCILSGNITIGSNIHISAYVALYGSQGIILDDYSGLSPRATIYSAMDDFSGNYLIGPIHPISCTNVQGGLVNISKYVQIGCNSVIFPNLTIGTGVVVGAMSLVNKNLSPWAIYAGIPAIRIKERTKELLKYVF
jgi:acetyltransferase-like isoleucine patch superfamily enzyme